LTVGEFTSLTVKVMPSGAYRRADHPPLLYLSVADL